MTAPALAPATTPRTLSEVIARAGGVPPERILNDPQPGTATEADVAELHNRENRLAELVDGVLVEKTVGAFESLIASAIIQILGAFVHETDTGVVLAPDGMLRLAPGLVRIPDVAFISWERLPGGQFPRVPIPDLVPDLVVEVLSPGNTEAEMERKLADYFNAGVRLVWLVYPDSRSARACTSATAFEEIPPDGELSGGGVLPGFSLSLRDLFARTARAR